MLIYNLGFTIMVGFGFIYRFSILHTQGEKRKQKIIFEDFLVSAHVFIDFNSYSFHNGFYLLFKIRINQIRHSIS